MRKITYLALSLFLVFSLISCDALKTDGPAAEDTINTILKRGKLLVGMEAGYAF